MSANLVAKRQLLAARAVLAAESLTAALSALRDLAAERASLSAPFDDADFATGLAVQVDGQAVRIDHLSAYLVGALFDFAYTPLSAAWAAGTPAPQGIALQVTQ